LNKTLHIICLDIPYPADYGGAIDMYFKIKSLSELGCQIHLHCFQYNHRKPSAHLEAMCTAVYYYPRLTGIQGVHPTLPYIISSRRNSSLLTHLQETDAPILFDGLHTTLYAFDKSLSGRQKILRAHNIESDYYAQLAAHTTNRLKRWYYTLEANRLKNYEVKLSQFSSILSISEQDFEHHQYMYSGVNHVYVPAFHPNSQVSSLEGIGSYCLYHGNLQVEENQEAVFDLVRSVFSGLSVPLIIAGRNPSNAILELANEHIKVIVNPDEKTLQHLMQHAHIHVLPFLQQTGMKLKIMNALFQGRHCITNIFFQEKPLQELLHFAPDTNSFQTIVRQLMTVPFSANDIQKRIQLLSSFSNRQNAAKIRALL
jgi:hypothetical protein